MLLLHISLVIFTSIYLTGADAREWTKNLTVANGGPDGVWFDAAFCPEGELAVGYDMKVEDYQFFGDDTTLNGIRLVCSGPSGDHFDRDTTVTSGHGAWGGWIGHVTCNQRPGGNNIYLRAFALQVEKAQKGFDDTAAGWVKFECADISGDTQLEKLNKDPGHGGPGVWGTWSDTCDANTAICGLSTRVQEGQANDDDTALNDVIFYCCELGTHSGPAVVGK